MIANILGDAFGIALKRMTETATPRHLKMQPVMRRYGLLALGAQFLTGRE
jgi:hypothetical protein